jgi:hypothetical protein
VGCLDLISGMKLIVFQSFGDSLLKNEHIRHVGLGPGMVWFLKGVDGFIEWNQCSLHGTGFSC